MRFSIPTSFVLFLILCGVASPYSSAEQDIVFSGFMNITVGRLGDDDSLVKNYDDQWSADSDTMIAFQAVVPINDRLSVTAQLVARAYDEDNINQGFRPQMEWLFLKYQLDSSFVRIGRTRTPLFLFADVLEVGYSYPWITPPSDVYLYFLNTFSSLDGIDYTWFSDLGESQLTLQAAVGNADGTLGEGVAKVDAKLMSILNATLEQGDWLGRLTLMRSDIDMFRLGITDLAPIYDNLVPVDPAFGEIADVLVLEDESFLLASLGLQYRPGLWDLTGEYMWGELDEKSGYDLEGYYLSAGYQLGRWMPYAVLGKSRLRPKNDIDEAIDATESIVPVGSNPGIDGLRGLTKAAIDISTASQDTATIGVRYDLDSQTALKLEYQRIDFKDNSFGQFQNLLQAPPDTNTMLRISYQRVF